MQLPGDNKAVNAFSQKEFNQQLPETFKGELGVLAKSINEMGSFLREIIRIWKLGLFVAHLKFL